MTTGSADFLWYHTDTSELPPPPEPPLGHAVGKRSKNDRRGASACRADRFKLGFGSSCGCWSPRHLDAACSQAPAIAINTRVCNTRWYQMQSCLQHALVWYREEPVAATLVQARRPSRTTGNSPSPRRRLAMHALAKLLFAIAAATALSGTYTAPPEGPLAEHFSSSHRCEAQQLPCRQTRRQIRSSARRRGPLHPAETFPLELETMWHPLCWAMPPTDPASVIRWRRTRVWHRRSRRIRGNRESLQLIRHRYGFRGVRVGEAENPGPSGPAGLSCRLCVACGLDGPAAPGSDLCLVHLAPALRPPVAQYSGGSAPLLPAQFTAAQPSSGGGRNTYAAAEGDFPMIMQRNTFVAALDPDVPPAQPRARALRRHRTDGDPPSDRATADGDFRATVQPRPASDSEADSVPPSQLRRINEDGDALPGSQDSALAAEAQTKMQIDPNASLASHGPQRPSPPPRSSPASGAGASAEVAMPPAQRQRAADHEARSPMADPAIQTHQNHPPQPSGADQPRRFYCPIAGCPASDHQRHAGWSSTAGLRAHLQEHSSGRLAGDVPRSTLDELNLNVCRVCSRLLSRKFGDACPRCRPSLSARPQDPGEGRPIPLEYPEIGEVCRSRVVTRKYVPSSAKALWSDCVTRALNQIVVHGDQLAWLEYFMLARAVLPAKGDRGGKAHKKRTEQHVKTRCRRWLEGEKAALWSDACRLASKVKQSRPSPQTNEIPDSLIHEHISAGQLSKAAAALVTEPPVEVTQAVIQEMQEKHPRARPADELHAHDLRPVDAACAVQTGVDEVLKAIRSFPRGSAPGCSGLRPQHLADALCQGMRHEALRQITAVVNRLLQGQVPVGVRPWLCGAKLAAIPKPQGDLRPVACGDTLRRVTAKAAFAEAGEEIRSLLEPLQVGVGTSGGAEAIVHATRQWLGRNSSNHDKVLLLVDLSNAFNTVDRWAVRQAFRRYVPRLVPWVDLCYGHPSVLLLGDSEIRSERGVHQGDPGGPAAFALSIHECVLSTLNIVQREFPGELDWAAFYLDDGSIAGTTRAVQRFLALLRSALKYIGLEVNLSKCEIIPAAGADSTAREDDFPGLIFRENGNFKLLGASFGGLDFHKSLLDRRVSKALKIVGAATQLESPQDAFSIIRSCAGFCKIVYSIRVTPPDMLRASMGAFEEGLRHGLETIVGSTLDERHWDQAGLSIKEGGLGLRRPTQHADAAYIASFRGSADLATAIDPHFDPQDAFGHSGLAKSICTFNAIVPNSEVISAHDLPQKQRHLSGQLDAAMRRKLLAENSRDRFFCAHLALVSAEGAGAWLTAFPEDECRSWEGDGELFRIALKRRCRVPVQDGDRPCPCCGAVMDAYGDHALVCSCRGDRTIRHNALRDLTVAEAVCARSSPEKEKQGLLPGRPLDDGAPCRQQQGESQRRPADVYLPRGLGEAKRAPAALDWAITSGLRADKVQQVVEGTSDILEEYADFKRNYKDTDAKCRRQGLKFAPLIMEAHGGGWGGQLRQAMGFLATQQKAAGDWCREGTALRMAQRIATTLQRENARAVLRRLSATTASLAEADLDLAYADEDAPC